MSNILEQASLVLVPSGYKSGKIYSQIPTSGDGDLQFTRASNATRVNSAGLIEKVRTNLALQSEAFDTASWFKSNTTITENAGVAPNGTTTADKIVPTTTGTNRWVEQSRAVTTSIPYANSFFVKADGFSWVAIHHIGGAVGAWFNVSSGTIGTITAGNTASITSVGNGWYRCSVTRTSGGTTGYSVIQLADSDNSSTATASGTNGLLIWGAQLEVSDFGATDYIPTTTAAVSVGMTANVPRLDYLGSSCPKLLLEPQTTALNQFSEQLNNAYWSLSRASAFGSGSVVNAVVAPDGTQSAEYVQQGSGQTIGGGALVGILSATGNYTISVFAKMAEQRYLRLAGTFGAGGAGLFCNFDLQNGVTGTPSAGVTPRIENYGNGWYRCSISASKVDLTGNLVFLYQANTLNGGDATPLSGLYLWGANVTQMAYPTSYIPTLGTSVTRVRDAASKTGITSLIGQTEGTLFVEFDLTQTPEINTIISISDGTFTSNFVLVYKTGTNVLSARIRTAGVDQVLIDTGTLASGSYKLALAYKQDDIAFYVNGVLIGTNNLATIPATLSRLSISEISTAVNPIFGRNAQTLVFKTRLSNTELAQLTTL